MDGGVELKVAVRGGRPADQARGPLGFLRFAKELEDLRGCGIFLIRNGTFLRPEHEHIPARSAESTIRHVYTQE